MRTSPLSSQRFDEYDDVHQTDEGIEYTKDGQRYLLTEVHGTLVEVPLSAAESAAAVDLKPLQQMIEAIRLVDQEVTRAQQQDRLDTHRQIETDYQGAWFGLLRAARAKGDYMQQFKQFLIEEGLPTNEQITEFVLPVVRLPLERPLKTIRIRPGHDFIADGPCLTLGLPDQQFFRRKVSLDCTPKLQVMVSNEELSADPTAAIEEQTFGPAHLAFLDYDQLYHEVVQFKEERGWTNLAITKATLEELLADERWYVLKAPAGALSFDGPQPLRRVVLWQELALTLLKKYVDRYYKARRQDYEKSFREYVTLDEDQDNFFSHYSILIQEAQDTFLPELERLKVEIEAGAKTFAPILTLHAIGFDRHLYSPLLYLGSKDLAIKPVPLNEGERDFILDLKQAYETQPGLFDGVELYVLRNLSRGRGIGFFEAGNFYPDFILWMVDGEQQRITFIDPKGIARLEGEQDPKINFYTLIKDIEREMGDPSITLSSFIVSNTRYETVAHWGLSKEDLEARHVVFQKDDRHRYISDIVTRVREKASV